MKYDKIKTAVSDKVIKKSQLRIQNNSTFNLIEENAKRWEEQRENTSFPLKLSTYEAEEIKEKKEGEKFEQMGKDKIPSFEISNVPSDLVEINAEESRKKRNADWISSVEKDPYIYEALQIIEDLN